MTSGHSLLLEQYLAKLTEAAKLGPIIDLACGNGRNGLYLLASGIPVIFADLNCSALDQIQQALTTATYKGKKELAECWLTDFEGPQPSPLADKQAGGIVIFRYLHRPLMESIKKAVLPGGIVIYETFTVDQPRYGHPNNPAFLLRHNELDEYFADWDILHCFEGVTNPGKAGAPQAIAQIVAIKPALNLG